MKRDKYMGMDVHQATTVVAVMNTEGKLVLETMVPTAATPIRGLIESLSGPLHVTLEESTQAEWLHEVIRDLVKEVVVCDPKRNKLLTEGSKGENWRTNPMRGNWRSCYGSECCDRSGTGTSRHVG